MLECQRCPGCSGAMQVGDAAASEDFVPQEADVVEDELCTWSHHPKVQGVPDDILKDASKRLKGRGVTFTMGCHIEYTAEMIAKLEEEERALQQKRETALVSKKVSEAKKKQEEEDKDDSDSGAAGGDGDKKTRDDDKKIT